MQHSAIPQVPIPLAPPCPPPLSASYSSSAPSYGSSKGVSTSPSCRGPAAGYWGRRGTTPPPGPPLAKKLANLSCALLKLSARLMVHEDTLTSSPASPAGGLIGLFLPEGAPDPPAAPGSDPLSPGGGIRGLPGGGASPQCNVAVSSVAAVPKTAARYHTACRGGDYTRVGGTAVRLQALFVLA